MGATPRATDAATDARHRPWVAMAGAAGVAAVLAAGFLRLPREDVALPDIARHALLIALPQWKTTEPVNEIVYGSRAFDTFGETFLLLAAVMSVVVLSRGREAREEYVGEAEAGAREQQDQPENRGGHSGQQREAADAERAEGEPAGGADESEEKSDRAFPEPGRYRAAEVTDTDDNRLGDPGPERSEAMTAVVRVAARVVAVPLAVASLYLCAWGYSPGGGFPAGAALVGVAVLLYAALGYRAVRPVLRPSVLEPLELAGAAAIVAIMLGGLIASGSFTANWVPLGPLQTIRSGGTLQLFSVSELVEVATGIAIALFSLLSMANDWTDESS